MRKMYTLDILALEAWNRCLRLSMRQKDITLSKDVIHALAMVGGMNKLRQCDNEDKMELMQRRYLEYYKKSCDKPMIDNKTKELK